MPASEAPAPSEPTEPEWLSDWQGRTLDPATALRRFDSLSGLEPEEMLGEWRGAELATGHPLDGILGRLGWYGKRFDSVDAVHPLLFRTDDGRVVSLDPSRMPFRLALRRPALARRAASRTAMALLWPVLRTLRPTARLRRIAFRGTTSAAMVYDRQPVTDHFRRVGPRTVIGLMETWDVPPFFFLLLRDDRPIGGGGQ